MMIDQPSPIEPKKQKYEPPRLVTISLRPEEAVLGHCKMSGVSGPVSSSCEVIFCSSIGS
jgi:hypothetical protein